MISSQNFYKWGYHQCDGQIKTNFAGTVKSFYKVVQYISGLQKRTISVNGG